MLFRSPARRRQADIQANTPARVLPTSRAELATWKAYCGFIEAGIEVFWSIYEKGMGDVAGLSPRSGTRPFVVETYPRYMIRRLWLELKIPSKRKEPERYVEVLSRLPRGRGYRWDEGFPLGVEYVDAMVCAIAAGACAEGDRLPEGTVGVRPEMDESERVLREGWL